MNNLTNSAVHCITGFNDAGKLRPYYMAAVGENPHGPKGGSAGIIMKGKFLKNPRGHTKLGYTKYFENRGHAQAAIDSYLAQQPAD